jgi:hypothetical protein
MHRPQHLQLLQLNRIWMQTLLLNKLQFSNLRHGSMQLMLHSQKRIPTNMPPTLRDSLLLQFNLPIILLNPLKMP